MQRLGGAKILSIGYINILFPFFFNTKAYSGLWECERISAILSYTCDVRKALIQSICRLLWVFDGLFVWIDMALVWRGKTEAIHIKYSFSLLLFWTHPDIVKNHNVSVPHYMGILLPFSECVELILQWWKIDGSDFYFSWFPVSGKTTKQFIDF